MEKIKKLFIDIDKKDLKIMKSGLILSFIISIIGAILLSYNLISLHSIFLYNIGLSIVKEVLKKHNFEFGVKSTLKKGSTFYFKIKK